MTTTTPESRGRIAYVAYCRGVAGPGRPIPPEVPSFDGLQAAERDAWIKAAGTIWDLATTGRASI